VVVLAGTPPVGMRTFQEENSLALYGFGGILSEFRVGLVLQESGDILVVIRSTQHHGGITFVSQKYGE
jgi:hypothetical protein